MGSMLLRSIFLMALDLAPTKKTKLVFLRDLLWICIFFCYLILTISFQNVSILQSSCLCCRKEIHRQRCTQAFKSLLGLLIWVYAQLSPPLWIILLVSLIWILHRLHLASAVTWLSEVCVPVCAVCFVQCSQDVLSRWGQCFGSGFIEAGSGSSITSQSGSEATEAISWFSTKSQSGSGSWSRFMVLT